MADGDIRFTMRGIEISFLAKGTEYIRYQLVANLGLENSILTLESPEPTRPLPDPPSSATEPRKSELQQLDHPTLSIDPFILRSTPPYSSLKRQKQCRKRRKCLVESKQILKAFSGRLQEKPSKLRIPPISLP